MRHMQSKQLAFYQRVAGKSVRGVRRLPPHLRGASLAFKACVLSLLRPVHALIDYSAIDVMHMCSFRIFSSAFVISFYRKQHM